MGVNGSEHERRATRALRPRPVAFAAIVLCVGVLAVAGQRADVWGGVDAQTQDLLQPGVSTAGEVVAVGIDRATLAEAGDPWPWPRERQAALLEAIADAGAATIVYDVVLNGASGGDEA